jgi:hypothetical protein
MVLYKNRKEDPFSNTNFLVFGVLIIAFIMIFILLGQKAKDKTSPETDSKVNANGRVRYRENISTSRGEDFKGTPAYQSAEDGNNCDDSNEKCIQGEKACKTPHFSFFCEREAMDLDNYSFVGQLKHEFENQEVITTDRISYTGKFYNTACTSYCDQNADCTGVSFVPKDGKLECTIFGNTSEKIKSSDLSFDTTRAYEEIGGVMLKKSRNFGLPLFDDRVILVRNNKSIFNWYNSNSEEHQTIYPEISYIVNNTFKAKKIINDGNFTLIYSVNKISIEDAKGIRYGTSQKEDAYVKEYNNTELAHHKYKHVICLYPIGSSRDAPEFEESIDMSESSGNKDTLTNNRNNTSEIEFEETAFSHSRSPERKSSDKKEVKMLQSEFSR